MMSYKNHVDIKNFDEDEEEEDLSDDEVFTHSSKSIPLDENGVNKPLMAPRQRNKDGLKTKVRKVPPFRVIWASVLYFLLTLSAIIGIICLVVFVINCFMKKEVVKIVKVKQEVKVQDNEVHYTPCTRMVARDMWVKTFPKLTTETAFRFNDVNGDGANDFLLGFGTGADAFSYPPVVCRVYFPSSNGSCGGGVMALDGKTGSEIWRHYAPHEIFALNCNEDIDKDGVKDCVCGGRMATFRALSGKTGKLLWDFNKSPAKVETSNVYTPIFVPDMDNDGIPDLIVMHGGDPLKKPGSKTRLTARLMIVSGKSGQVLRWAKVPDGKESYYSPQLLQHPDGSQLVLFGTGGETHGGSLWYIRLTDLAKGNMRQARILYTDEYKGIMTPPVLADITGDDVLDIVMAMFNSTVIAFNGATFSKIWEYHQPSSESYSTPGVGHFNDDNVLDFVISYQFGPGFPIYYYSQTTILDGRNGMPLLKTPIKTLVGTQSSPLVINTSVRGNDIFLFWVADCPESQKLNHLEFDFVKGTSIHDQSRVDLCQLRYKRSLITQLYGLSRDMRPPGVALFDSTDRLEIEYGNPINYTALGLEFLTRNPEYREVFEQYLAPEQSSDYQDFLKVLDTRFEYPMPNSKILEAMNGPNQPYDPNEDYGMNDGRSDADGYSPYYSPPKYSSLSNNFYDVSDYYRGAHASHPQYRMRFRPVKERTWPQQFQDPLVYNDYAQSLMDKKDGSLQAMQKRSIIEKYLQLIGKSKEPKRDRKHVGPHDAGGVQRVISTGTLVSPVYPAEPGIDMVFATYWIPSSNAQGLFPKDQECITSGMKLEEERFKTTSQFYGMDHDAYQEMVTEECLRKSGHLNPKNSSKSSDYNPFNRPMGQMTIYRLHLTCICKKKSGKVCSKILPFSQQMWTSYMGRYGDCVTLKHRTI